ncbi:MAG: MATE family efflux transporter [Bdellovibrionota bacterium]
MKKYFLSTLCFSIPIIFSRAGSQILTMLNIAIIGQYGAKNLSTFSLTSSPYFTFVLIALCLTSGLPISFAKNKNNNDLLSHKLFISSLHWIVLSFSAAVACVFLSMTVKNPEVQRVFILLALSAPGFIGTFVFGSSLEALGKAKINALTTFTAIPLNAGLNLLLIKLLPTVGVVEACVIGMGLTRIIMTAFLIQQVLKIIPLKFAANFLSKEYQTTIWQEFWEDIKFGAPIAFTYGLRSSGTTALTLFIAKFGNQSVASFSIVAQLMLLSTLISRGVSSASIIKVSELIGKRQGQEINSLVFSSVAVTAFLIGILSAILGVAPDYVFRLFTNDSMILTSLTSVVIPLFFVFITDAIAGVLIGALRALGDRWIPQLAFGLSIVVVPFILQVSTLGNFPSILPNILATLFVTQLIAMSIIIWRYTKYFKNINGYASL